MTLQEKQKMCVNACAAWVMTERHGKNMSIHDKDIEKLFTSQIILQKFKAFGIDIVLPDMLLLMLAICVDGNPGIFQVVLKELLENIKSRKGSIPAGYTITSDDFSMCFTIELPMIEVPEIYQKYEKLWDGQKRETHKEWETDNKCDTPEWWKEVMQ